MNENTKLDEAKYFYARLKAEAEVPESFRYELSAFLSASRTVLQYALNEAKTKPGGKQWYEQRVSQRPVLRFFKDKRDVNIHQNPVTPGRHFALQLSETLRVSDSVIVTVQDTAGNIVQEGRSESESPAPPPPTEARVESRWIFDDWSGSEDIPTLCGLYLDEVQAFVNEGKSNGVLAV